MMSSKYQTSGEDGELTVTHMFYTAWPDHGVPRNAMSLISFIRRVRKEHPTSLATPLLVHCSAGVGRTGTFILLDLAMQQMKTQGTLSIFQHIKNMRSQRMKMVQTLVCTYTSSVKNYWFLMFEFLTFISNSCWCRLSMRSSMTH